MASRPGEFELIDKIRAGTVADPRIALGIGDDAAVISAGPDRVWLVAADMLLEGRHFEVSTATPRLIGRKSLAVNLSDLAAMAGKPVAGFVTVAHRREYGYAFAEELHAGIQALADEHGMTAPFACGSFVPRGATPRLEMPDDVAWLATGGPDGYEELEMEPDEFDIVFAYPWPGEEQVIFDLFAGSAAVGALLLTYHGQDGLKLHRKVR